MNHEHMARKTLRIALWICVPLFIIGLAAFSLKTAEAPFLVPPQESPVPVSNKIPRLSSYPDKEIEARVNSQIDAIERSQECYEGETDSDLRDSLKLKLDMQPEGHSVTASMIDGMKREELLRELSTYNYYNATSTVARNSDDIFSIRIHAEYFCGGPYPTNDSNQSVTFDLKTGEQVSFPDLFADYERDSKKINEILYAAKPAEGLGECPSILQGIVESGEASSRYSLDGQYLVAQLELPHVIEACSTEQKIPVSRLREFINPQGILGRIK